MAKKRGLDFDPFAINNLKKLHTLQRQLWKRENNGK